MIEVIKTLGRALLDSHFIHTAPVDRERQWMSEMTHPPHSVAQSCPTLCNPTDCSTPGFPVHCQLLEFTQTHVHWVGDAIQPSHLPKVESKILPLWSSNAHCIDSSPPFFFLKTFWCEPFLKSLLNLLQFCFCFVFWFFGHHEACGTLGPRQGIEPETTALEGEFVTTGPPGKFQQLPISIPLVPSPDFSLMSIPSLNITGCTGPVEKYATTCELREGARALMFSLESSILGLPWRSSG